MLGEFNKIADDIYSCYMRDQASGFARPPYDMTSVVYANFIQLARFNQDLEKAGYVIACYQSYKVIDLLLMELGRLECRGTGPFLSLKISSQYIVSCFFRMWFEKYKSLEECNIGRKESAVLGDYCKELLSHGMEEQALVSTCCNYQTVN